MQPMQSINWRAPHPMAAYVQLPVSTIWPPQYGQPVWTRRPPPPPQQQQQQQTVQPSAPPAPAPKARKGQESQFEEYISRDEAIQGVLEGRYACGTLGARSFCTPTAFVRNRRAWGAWTDIAIEGKTNRNRALDGDVVVVALDDPSRWKEREAADPPAADDVPSGDSPSDDAASDVPSDEPPASWLPAKRDICRALQADAPAQPDADTVESLLADAPLPPHVGSGKLGTGRVVHILEARHKRRTVGVARVSARKKPWVHYEPSDISLPLIQVFVKDFCDDAVRRDSQAYLCHLELLPWRRDQAFPQAKMLKVLGKLHDVETETRALLCRCGTDYTDEFSAECLAAVPDTAPIPDARQLRLEGRRDLRPGAPRERFVVSIDPATARDLDDALSCHPLGNGTFKVGVHIADVSSFVPFGSALDKEARRRATSVYTVQGVVPMLPRKLCEEFCSLNTKGDKLAFTVEWTMDKQGNILDEWMGQTVIRNQCMMSYEQAQGLIDGTGGEANLDLAHLPAGERAVAAGKAAQSVRLLAEIAAGIRGRRQAAGALELGQAKLQFEFADGDRSTVPTGWHLHECSEANWLVEDFMVMANARVMEKCREFCPDVSLARFHAAPNALRFEALNEALRAKGMPALEGRTMEESLAALAGHPREAAVKALATRCMKRAKYGCSADAENPSSLAHFGLGLELYTHFTSPIRRYADLVVHRVLKCALEIEKLYAARLAAGDAPADVQIRRADIPSGHLLLSSHELHEVAVHCNDRSEEARTASDESARLYYCLYLQAKFNAAVKHDTDYVEKHHCVLSRVRKYSFNVFIETLGLEVNIWHSNKEKDQTWVGANMRSPRQNTMCIEWAPGQFQTCAMLTDWVCHVWHDQASKTPSFVVRLLPPSPETLVGKAEAEAHCPQEADPTGESE